MANTIEHLRALIDRTGRFRIGELVSTDESLVELAEFVDSLGDEWKLNLIRAAKRRYLSEEGVILDYAAYAKLAFVLSGEHQCALFSSRKVNHLDLIQLLEYQFVEQRDEELDSEDRTFEDLLVLAPYDVIRDFCFLREMEELAEILENLLRSGYYLDIEEQFWAIMKSCDEDTQDYLRLVAEEVGATWLPDEVKDEERRMSELVAWVESI